MLRSIGYGKSCRLLACGALFLILSAAQLWGQPAAGSVSPSSGGTVTANLMFTSTDPNGPANVAAMSVDIAPAPTPTSWYACFIYVRRSDNALYLADDYGNFPAQPGTLGQAGVLENDQCAITGSSLAVSGNNVNLTLQLMFKGGFVGAQNVYLQATDYQGLSSSWTQVGTWTVPADQAPSSISPVSPNSGIGATPTFTFQSSDQDGYLDIVAMSMDIAPTLSSYHACFIYVRREDQQIYLADDNGNFSQPSATLGQSGTLSNSQCTVNVENSSLIPNGANGLQAVVALTFASSFIGGMQVSLQTTNEVTSSSWVQVGTWTIPVPLITNLTDLQTCVGQSGTAQTPRQCILAPAYSPFIVNTPIVLSGSNIVVGGANPTGKPILARGQDLVCAIMELGRDSSCNTTTIPVTGVTIQNLTFCGGALNHNGDPNDPCPPTTTETTCEHTQNGDAGYKPDEPLYRGQCTAELSIANSGPGQSWAAPASAPFSNSSPYNVTVSNVALEDSPSLHNIFIAPLGVGQNVNDVYISGSVISSGGVQIGTYNTPTNWNDYTQCDNWNSVYGTAFADDTRITIPRDIRFDNNDFWVNAGAVSGFGRYVQFTGNRIHGYYWSSEGGGGAIEQETCADQVLITGNTLTGVYPLAGSNKVVSGTELYSRNLTVNGNSISGFGAEGLTLLSVNTATANGNSIWNNSLVTADNIYEQLPQLKLATRFPGNGDCFPGIGSVQCSAMRDEQGVTVQNNSSNGQLAGYVAYGVLFDATGDGPTDKIQVTSVQNNSLSFTTAEVGTDPRVTVTGGVSPSPQPTYTASASPQTIAVFPEGNAPLGTIQGMSLGTPCITYDYSFTPPHCTQYGTRGTFRFGATDPTGASVVTDVEVFLDQATSPNPGQMGVGGPYLPGPFCHFVYYFASPNAPAVNTLYLDQNTTGNPNEPYTANWSLGSAIYTGPARSNSVCTIYPATSGYATIGSNGLFLYLDIQFNNNSSGAYYLYEVAVDEVWNGSGYTTYASTGNSFGAVDTAPNDHNPGSITPWAWSLWGYWPIGQVQ